MRTAPVLIAALLLSGCWPDKIQAQNKHETEPSNYGTPPWAVNQGSQTNGQFIGPVTVDNHNGIVTCDSGCVQHGTDCDLRIGPVSPDEVKDGAHLLIDLDFAKDSLAKFEKAKDTEKTDFYFYGASETKAGEITLCLRGNDNCRTHIDLGTVGDVRPWVTTVLKTRIHTLACKLRAIGVEVPVQ